MQKQPNPLRIQLECISPEPLDQVLQASQSQKQSNHGQTDQNQPDKIAV
jgi:hypothetical protein